MFVKVMYLSVFYCLCYDTNLATDYLEEQVVEDRDPDLDDMDDIRFDEIWEDHWRDLAEESNDKKNIHVLRWCVYVKEKEELIMRSFLVSVPHPKGGKKKLDLREGPRNRRKGGLQRDQATWV